MRRKGKPTSAAATKLALDPAVTALLWPIVRNGEIGECRLACVRVGSGSREIVGHCSFSGPSALAEASGWIAAQTAAMTVIMLPGSEVICRTIAMPTGSKEQLEMALRLQIENLLLGGSARWRTDGAILPATSADSARTALVVEWPNSHKVPPALDDFIKSGATGFAPPIAGLVPLTTGALAMGARESLAIFLERSEGSISIAYSDGIKGALRIVREDGSDHEAWRASVVRATCETLILADFSESAVDGVRAALEAALDTSDDGLLAPLAGGFDSFHALLPGTPTDEEWWRTSGVLAGMALAVRSSLDRLCSLQAYEKVTRPGFFPHLLQLASTRKFAIRAAIAALVLLALFPPAASGARLLYLMWLLPEPEAFARVLDRSDQQGAMYLDYEKYAWPMTKLLGDVASTTPEGIELETISIAQGGPVSISGNAKPRGDSASASEAILTMESQMRESGVFDRVEKSWDAPNANGVIKFDLTAAIVKPSLVPNYPEAQDFAKLTLRDRKYGPADSDAATTPTTQPSAAVTNDGAAGVVAAARVGAGEGTTAPGAVPAAPANQGSGAATLAAPSTASGSAGSAPGASGESAVAVADPAGDGRRRPVRGASSSAPDIARRGRPGAEPAAPVVPEPLSDEQIEAMSQAEAREAAGRVSSARGMAGIDEATEQRLKAEFYKLLARARRP